MPLRIQPGDWDKFVERYRRDTSQWYLIPKAKTYDEESIRLLIRGLALLHKWFCEPEALSTQDKEFLRNYLKDSQPQLFPDELLAVRWGNAAQVLFAAKLFEEGVVSREQQNAKLKKQFDDVINGVTEGGIYCDMERRFGRRLLIEWFSANARNIINIYQRLGLAWIEKDHFISMTLAGKRLIEPGTDYKPLFEHQLRKLQFYNPSFEGARGRYAHIRVFPFHFCLQIVLAVEPHEITLEEFALFVTKARAMEDASRCVAWISEFRKLNDQERQELLRRLKKRQRRRARPLLVESLETARKNINLLTLSGPWTRCKIGDSDGIVLTDEDKAKNILAEDKNLQFVDFDSKESWFCYFGDVSKKYDVEAAIKYYTRMGKPKEARKLAQQAPDKNRGQKVLKEGLKEKDIEDFVRDRLGLIESGLRLYKMGRRVGQQFETPDGGIIDLLTVTEDGSFVVIEFKRDKTSDEAVGQVLRYMGWVKKHLSPAKTVRGYIVASDFDKFIQYSLMGMQHPQIPNRHGKDLIYLYRHGFDATRMGTVILNAVDG